MKITLEKTDELMDMLTGESLPYDMLMSDQPQLTRARAFSVIWYLQEHLHIIPDHYEMCTCGNLFDAHCSGHVIDGTDEPDEWQRDLGVTQEMLETADGMEFCSSSCEYKYWIDMSKEINDD